MLTKISFKKIIVFILLFFICLFLFFYFNFSKKEIIVDSKLDQTHNWTLISKLLTEENYNKIWINPNKYNTFKSFLLDFKTFSWVLIDPINEKFVIWLKTSDKDTTFIPFDFKKSNNIFDDSNNKNLAILDIYSAYKKWWLYWWVDSKVWNKVLFETDLQHPKTAELNGIFAANVFNQSNNVYNKIKWLEKSDNIWISNMELLAYLYDFTWDYSKWSDLRKKICDKYTQKCDNDIDVKVTWYVLWSDSYPIVWAKVELLNNGSVNTLTDDKWFFTLNFKNSSFSHLRFKSSLEWYSDWFNTVSLNNNYSWNSDIVLDFNLNKSENHISINNENRASFIKWKYYIVDSENSKYFIPIDGLYYKDWNKFTWNNLDIYTYLFKKTSNMNSMLENDTFEPVYWYVWNIMKTFGMPYIQFIDKDTWKELFIKSSNPMVLQNQIYHMKELYENHDKIYQELTKEDMKFLVSKSEELGWYPIDFDFLIKNNLLRWPAWWSLDRVTWIWHNVWSRVVNVDWLVELPFYHIKDN